MPDYQIEVSATAEKQLRKLETPNQLRIISAIRKLAIDPRPKGVRKLRGYDDVYRLRTGRFRIIYSVEDQRLVIIVLKLGHRKAAYR